MLLLVATPPGKPKEWHSNNAYLVAKMQTTLPFNLFCWWAPFANILCRF